MKSQEQVFERNRMPFISTIRTNFALGRASQKMAGFRPATPRLHESALLRFTKKSAGLVAETPVAEQIQPPEIPNVPPGTLPHPSQWLKPEIVRRLDLGRPACWRMTIRPTCRESATINWRNFSMIRRSYASPSTAAGANRPIPARLWPRQTQIQSPVANPHGPALQGAVRLWLTRATTRCWSVLVPKNIAWTSYRRAMH
jgi:hypothetical protein